MNASDEPQRPSMWEGDGWKKTRRQLGVIGFGAATALAWVTGDVPWAFAALIGGLLGLDVLGDKLKEPPPK